MNPLKGKTSYEGNVKSGSFFGTTSEFLSQEIVS
jgi:hypothetical protein